eukprot:TRINITY_DN31593_c0_g1_i1.p1 TRINITY_DN31593_c0_g1~~TRINITY_DN31593_c0_g1_i1.p1  ORF type:complete len:218 (+),score=51.57 TRINITY_DN31593_c0_g1_i1:1-654(+)
MKFAAFALAILVGLVAADDPTTCCLPHSLSLWGLSLNMFEGQTTMFSAHVDYGHDEIEPSKAHFYISNDEAGDYEVIFRGDKLRTFVVFEDGTCEIHPAGGSQMNPCINPDAQFVSTTTLGSGEVDNFYYEESAMAAWYTISSGEECKIANVYVMSEEFGTVGNTMYFGVTEKEFEEAEFDIPEPCMIPESTTDYTTMDGATTKTSDKYTNLVNFDL